MKILSLIVLFLTAAAQLAAQSDHKKSQAEVEILAVMVQQSTAWNRGDIEGFMQGYWNSDKLTFSSGDRTTRGWQATLDRYKKDYATATKMGTLTFSDIEITLLSKDAAVVLGSWALARETDNPKGKFTLIFRKMKEGWRIVHDHSS